MKSLPSSAFARTGPSAQKDRSRQVPPRGRQVLFCLDGASPRERQECQEEWALAPGANLHEDPVELMFVCWNGESHTGNIGADWVGVSFIRLRGSFSLGKPGKEDMDVDLAQEDAVPAAAAAIFFTGTTSGRDGEALNPRGVAVALLPEETGEMGGLSSSQRSAVAANWTLPGEGLRVRSVPVAWTPSSSSSPSSTSSLLPSVANLCT